MSSCHAALAALTSWLCCNHKMYRQHLSIGLELQNWRTCSSADSVRSYILTRFANWFMEIWGVSLWHRGGKTSCLETKCDNQALEPMFLLFSYLFFFFLLFFLLCALCTSSLCLLLQQHPISSTHLSPCTLLGEIKLCQALMAQKSTSLPLFLLTSLHSCLLALTPSWVWQASFLIPSFLARVSLNTWREDQGGKEWWMAIPKAFSFPVPDRSPLIAFPRLSFAGNGLKHDISLTHCFPREREGVP